MANIKSQIKRNRQNEVRRQRNQAVYSQLKTLEKSVETAVAAGEDPSDAMRTAQKRIDMAQSKGMLHRNTAARRKSRLTRLASRSTD